MASSPLGQNKKNPKKLKLKLCHLCIYAMPFRAEPAEELDEKMAHVLLHSILFLRSVSLLRLHWLFLIPTMCCYRVAKVHVLQLTTSPVPWMLSKLKRIKRSAQIISFTTLSVQLDHYSEVNENSCPRKPLPIPTAGCYGSSWPPSWRPGCYPNLAT